MTENIQNEVNEDHMNIIERYKRYKQYLDDSSTKTGGQSSSMKPTREGQRTSTFSTVALQGY